MERQRVSALISDMISYVQSMAGDNDRRSNTPAMERQRGEIWLK